MITPVRGFFRAFLGASLVVIGLPPVGCGGRSGLFGLSQDGGPAPDALPSCLHPTVSAVCGTDGFCTLPAGCYTMGSPKNEPCRYANETAHRVTLSRGFRIGQREVTQGEFSSKTGYTPSYFKTCGSSCPVEQVSWHMAAFYCNTLSAAEKRESCYSCTGTISGNLTCAVAAAYQGSGSSVVDCQGYRLPTEAEWEYAYRAGTTTALTSGALDQCTGQSSALDRLGWYANNAGKQTHAGGMKQKNGWGLFDMAGNVWEWTGDLWTQDLGTAWVTDPVGPTSAGGRVVRGGSWSSSPGDSRAAFRDEYAPTSRYNTIGFRCARTLSAYPAGVRYPVNPEGGNPDFVDPEFSGPNR